MTKEDYLKIVNDHSHDCMDVIYFLYTLRGGKLDRVSFNESFIYFMMTLQVRNKFRKIIEFTFNELNKHFNV